MGTTVRYSSPVVDQPERYEHSLVRYQATVVEILRRYRQPEPWWADAACHGDGAARWFPEPESHRRATPPELRELCDGCPVRDECAEAGRRAYAGVWAGRLISTNRSALKDIAYRGPRPPRALAG